MYVLFLYDAGSVSPGCYRYATRTCCELGKRELCIDKRESIFTGWLIRASGR